MARIVLGLGTSHSPQLSLPAEHWLQRGEEDQLNQSLYRVPDGKHVTYEELLAEVDPGVAKELTPEEIKTYAWVAQMERLIPPNAAIAITNKTGAHVSNHPAVYWADSNTKPVDFFFVDETEIGNQTVRAMLKQDEEAGKLQLLGRHGTMVLYKGVTDDAL